MEKSMKKLIVMLLSYLIIMSPIKAFAESNASVEIKVIGEIKKGSNIEILIDVKNVDNLYAASIDFIYDTKQLKVESIKPTEYITKNIDNIMELGGEVDKNGNIATYSFTFLGDVDGLRGSGTLVKINAKALNNDKLSITKDNMKVKLVQKANGTVKNYDYNFIGYNVGNGSSSDSPNGSDSSNGNSSNNDGSNNTSGNDGVSGNGSSTGNNNSGNSSSSGSNSSNEENDNLQDSDNKKVDTDKKNNDSSDNTNEENKNDKDSKDESSISREEDKENIDKTSKINDSKSEVSKHNIANVVYVLIAIGVLGGVGYYYYRFRKK